MGIHYFPPQLGMARCLSYDGQILGGNGSRGAYRWKVREGVIEWLGPPDWFYRNFASATAMSWDGKVVAGWYARNEMENFPLGFVWREGVGAVDLYEAFRGFIMA